MATSGLAPYFLQFMNDALSMYKDKLTLGHIQACDFTQDLTLPDIVLIKNGQDAKDGNIGMHLGQYFCTEGKKLTK